MCPFWAAVEGRKRAFKRPFEECFELESRPLFDPCRVPKKCLDSYVRYFKGEKHVAHRTLQRWKTLYGRTLVYLKLSLLTWCGSVRRGSSVGESLLKRVSTWIYYGWGVFYFWSEVMEAAGLSAGCGVNCMSASALSALAALVLTFGLSWWICLPCPKQKK